uniref:Pentatricopeptide repeat-containing protein n=1 Tax=Tanacetum cinerariifolium TaxID=118510 RepID=A0A699ICZ1_TANCI|nr:pentatricopeptide repeat-containing protein [Tanacetum cinerariifolium]
MVLQKTEAKNAPKVRKQQTQAANEGTSSGVRQRKQYFVGDNETVIEHEGFMDDLLRNLSQDNGNGMTDPFHIVETKVEKWALNEGDTTIEDHYGYIKSYAKAIQESNLGQLLRPSVGEILAAIGRNANNHIFPVAWAVVNVEKKDNWSWFLDLLGDDLEMPTCRGLTLMFNQHKGLTKAVKEVMPYVEHRQCARHIYEGFRKEYSGVKFWHVIPTGGHLFEVRNRSEAFGVDEECRNCTCRLWQLSCLPCCHAIVVIFKLNRMVEDYVPDCYRKQAFYDTYHQYLTPVGGMTFWPDYSGMSRVLPPKPRTMPGRPRKKRIRASLENKNPNKVSKASVTMTFKKGRSRKTPLVGSSLIDKEIETPYVDEQVRVEEQASQYDVGGSSQFDVGGSSQFDVGGEEQVTQFDMGGSSDVRGTKKNFIGGSAQFGVRRGRRVKTTVKRRGAGYRRGSVPSRRFSNLGRWFGLGENDYESDPIENSEMAQETNQNAANDSFATTQETHHFSASAFSSTQNSQNHQVSEQEPRAAEQEPHRAIPRGILNFTKPRPRSERILKKKLAKKVHGIGSTSSNALNLE